MKTFQLCLPSLHENEALSSRSSRPPEMQSPSVPASGRVECNWFSTEVNTERFIYGQQEILGQIEGAICSVRQPTNGNAWLTFEGDVLFIPYENFTGEDSFTCELDTATQGKIVKTIYVSVENRGI